MKNRKKAITEHPFDVDEEESEKGEERTYDETEDIYDEEQREEMLQDDEISVAEDAFMQGQEMAQGEVKRKKKKQLKQSDEHEDTPSVELAKEDARREY